MTLNYFSQIVKKVERVMGIEPTQPAWKAGILAVELHPHLCFCSQLADLFIISKMSKYVNNFFKNILKNDN